MQRLLYLRFLKTAEISYNSILQGQRVSCFSNVLSCAKFATECCEDSRKSEGAGGDDEKKFKVLVTHPEVTNVALDLLRPTCNIVMCKEEKHNRKEIISKIAGSHAVLWACKERLDAEVLDIAGPQLKCISVITAGFDFVDVEELRRRKMPLGHTPGVVNRPVAEIALGLMVAAARRFHEGRKVIEGGRWENYHINWMLGKDIRDSTVGFFGFGRIAATIVKVLKGLRLCRILYTALETADAAFEAEHNVSAVDFDELLAESDFIIIIAPLNKATRNVFNAEAFCKMKNDAILINVGRGPIVNQEDLYDALKSGKIFAAGVDVVHPEPWQGKEKLLTLPNFVMTPHLGASTPRTRIDMAMAATKNILAGLAGKPLITPAYK